MALAVLALVALGSACLKPLPPTSRSSGWIGEYYTNPNLLGTPAFTRDDGPEINFDWGQDSSPGPQVPPDRFSVRWTRTLAFDEGVHEFTTTSDDGTRVFVDGELILDYWVDQPATTHSVSKMMTAGMHTVVVEYYENFERAMIEFSTALHTDPSTPTPAPPPALTSTPSPPGQTVKIGVDAYVEHIPQEPSGLGGVYKYVVGRGWQSYVSSYINEAYGNGLRPIFVFYTNFDSTSPDFVAWD
jgi:hypothetical protein